LWKFDKANQMSLWMNEDGHFVEAEKTIKDSIKSTNDRKSDQDTVDQ